MVVAARGKTHRKWMGKRKAAGDSYRSRFAKQYQAIYRTPGTELKTCDINNAGTPPMSSLFSTTGTVTLLNTIIPGSDVNQRVGRRIHMHSLHVIGRITSAQVSYAEDYLRLVVVYDRQPNSSAPSWSNVFQSIDNASNTSSTAYDFPHPAYYDRYKIMADVRLDMNTTGIGADQVSTNATNYKNEVHINRYIKLKGAEAHYDLHATTDEPTSGALVLLTFGTVAAASAPFKLLWTARLRYNDY